MLYENIPQIESENNETNWMKESTAKRLLAMVNMYPGLAYFIFNGPNDLFFTWI